MVEVSLVLLESEFRGFGFACSSFASTFGALMPDFDLFLPRLFFDFFLLFLPDAFCCLSPLLSASLLDDDDDDDDDEQLEEEEEEEERGEENEDE